MEVRYRRDESQAAYIIASFFVFRSFKKKSLFFCCCFLSFFYFLSVCQSVNYEAMIERVHYYFIGLYIMHTARGALGYSLSNSVSVRFCLSLFDGQIDYEHMDYRQVVDK